MSDQVSQPHKITFLPTHLKNMVQSWNDMGKKVQVRYLQMQHSIRLQSTETSLWEPLSGNM